MRSERGQAAVDYLALLAVLAVLFAAAVTTWIDPAAFGGAVGRTFARGLCIVQGGACDADLKPCIVASEKRSRGIHVNLVIVSAGKGRYILRERRSDGTIALTDYRDVHGRLGGSKGGEVRVGRLSVGGEVSFSLMARHGSGSTYMVASEEEADRLQRALETGEGDPPTPQETFGELRTDREYGASGSVGGWGVVDAGLRARDRDGTRTAADGSRTVTYEHGEGWNADVLGLPLRRERERLQESYSVRVDPSGRPRELVVTTAGRLDGAQDLPASVTAVAGDLLASEAAQRTVVVEAHLDLGDPISEAIARTFVAEVRDARPRLGGASTPTARLRARLREAGTIEARVYAVERHETGSADSIGIGSNAIVERSRLMAAVSRGYDGRWRSRDDCAA